jgi:sigma-B regulation protein RsbU (phosphoserine phosphatase)
MAATKILIAEDDFVSRRMLERVLINWNYDVTTVEDGQAAWEILRGQNAPHLAILDWSMPKMEGVEVCRRVRELGESAPYIILLTSHDNKSDIVQGLSKGADDYLTKPFDRDELQARLNVGLRILQLQGALTRQLSEIDDTLQRIQSSFLLGKCPKDLEGIQVAAVIFPSLTVAGDFYDFYRHSERCFDLIIGDVMGKGTKAALFGAATTNRLLRSMNELMSGNVNAPPPPAADIINSVNRQMVCQLSEVGSFVTLCYARFDLDAGQCQYIDCGHVKTIHYRADNDTLTFLEGGNLPLGILEEEEFATYSVDLHEGDVFLFYSDGLTEFRNSEGDMFGSERLADLVRQVHSKNPDDIISEIRRVCAHIASNNEFTDDLTCIAVKIETGKLKHSLPASELQISSDPQNLNQLREFVHSFCQQSLKLQEPSVELRQFELAVHEATAAIMHYACKNRTDWPIKIRIGEQSGKIILQIYYQGSRLDLHTSHQDTLESESSNRLGIHILAQLLDSVNYGTDKNGLNCLTLEKVFQKPV